MSQGGARVYQVDDSLRKIGFFSARLGAVVGVLLVFVLLLSARASASYEQVGIFAGSLTLPEELGVFPEEVQLGGVGGMAVNYTGAGGVPAGTVYAMTRDLVEGTSKVAMYVPKAGGLEFREAWQVEPGEPYERCGVPAGLEACKPRVASGFAYAGVAVDETTGNVYAFAAETSSAGKRTIAEYSPDGSKEITSFGEQRSGRETVAESPQKRHDYADFAGGLAVDGSGRVYAADETKGTGETYHRLMVFEPKTPGDYEHYEYAGETMAGLEGEGNVPLGPVTDAAGHIYVVSSTGTTVEEYEKETPEPYHVHHSAPICRFEYSNGGVFALTVNPQSSEVFFTSYKTPKLVHRLSACEGGVFHELETFELTPAREESGGASVLTFDPVRQFTAGRGAGTLYAGSPTPGQEKGQSSLGYIFAPPEENPPVVADELVGGVTASTARLSAQVNPKGYETRYAFQYETEGEYEAEEPDETQAVTVKATGGLFRLAFEGQATGGAAKATLSAGSRAATALVVAEGTATTNSASNVLDGVTVSFGSFEVGQPLTGPGIPPATVVTAVEPGKITLSKAATATASGVAVSSAGPAPLMVGESVEGAGIAAGTKIVAVQAGGLTLSQPASASAGGVVLQAGIAFDASAGLVRRDLESLSLIGARDVSVTGGPGDEMGSSPYQVTFTGVLADRDVPQMTVDSSRLTGGIGASVSTTHNGGSGFSGSGVREAPVGGAILEGLGARGVGVQLTGLTPDTAYRLRVVATSHCSPSEPGKVCQDIGEEKAFRTFPSEDAGLPDRRAYELVSPAQKHGGQVIPADPEVSSCRELCKPGVFFTFFPMESSPDGEAVAYEGTPFAETGGGTVENEYISRRGEDGEWQTSNPTPELLNNTGKGFQSVSTGLDRAVISQASPALNPEAPSECEDLYAQVTGEPSSLVPLLKSQPPNRPCTGFGHFKIRFAGASEDGQRIFLEANDALTGLTVFAPQAADGGASKFNLYEWHEGQLTLVNVKPGNTETEPGAFYGSIFGARKTIAHAVSVDGSHVYWTEQGTGQLYVRIDGEETQKIEDPGEFLSASTDGTKVLLSDGCLYDITTKHCEDLSAGHGGFQGIAGQSEDLSHVYFVDTAVLSGEEENEAGSVAREDEPNLYVWDAGTTRFIATLNVNDNSELGDWAASPSIRSAQASPDGRWVSFLSHSPLTGYDNTKRSGGGGAMPEAFVYDSVTGRLTCASCDPSGALPLARSVLRLINGNGGDPNLLPQARYLSNSGRLFFDSGDSLTPADSNEGAEDVYEWEPQNIGTCQRTSGCVALISSGAEGTDSNLLTTDTDGENVFFTTRSRLVARDTDDLIDLYDARVGGGETRQAKPPELCEREPGACESAPSAPVFGALGSASFMGPGNLVSVPAVAGKPKAKSLTRAQRLARALRVCRREHARARVVCEKRARKQYGKSSVARQGRRGR
jgi:hypothetical protein